MSSRVSETILLCEDEEQERLTRTFMKACGLPAMAPQLRSRVASQMEHGGNIGWVIKRFPAELHACRHRHRAKAETLLIVFIDADDCEVVQRRRQLLDELKKSDVPQYGSDEPAVLLIAKRHVETWIRSLLGELVTEEEDCKTRERSSKGQIRLAAQALREWSRPNAIPGATCVPSLLAALPEWHRIG